MRLSLGVVRHVNFFLATSAGAIYLYTQESRAEKLKLMMELKVNDVPIPVPPEINNVINEVKNDMKLKEEKKYLIKPFMIQSLDLKHSGFANIKTKSFLGIPHYFLYEDKNDANFITLVKENIIPRNSEEVQALIDSMCLSKAAKKFGIAHELYELINSQIPIIGMLPVVTVTTCNAIGFLIEKFSKGPVAFYYKIHALIYLLGALGYFLAFNLIISYKETKSDFLASELGKSYTQGGIEYYNKMIKRNKIIKKLNFKAPYREDGNVQKSVLRVFQVPLSRKITYLKDLSKAKKKKPSVWTYILHIY